MSYTACIVAVAPLRREADHSSEMVSQLLLGEFAEVLEITHDFVRIRCLYDGYEGWCQRKQLEAVEEVLTTDQYLREAIGNIEVNHEKCRISLGTPIFNAPVQLKYTRIDYTLEGIATGKLAFDVATIHKVTREFLNTPYIWGGKSIFGVDCSGFTQQVFKLFDIKLPRDAYQQAETGELVGFLQQSQCGDLAFFDNEEGRIIHVGIILDTAHIIHSSGKVSIDKLDNEGIVNAVTGLRTHHLRIIKRVLSCKF